MIELMNYLSFCILRYITLFCFTLEPNHCKQKLKQCFIRSSWQSASMARCSLVF